METSDYADFIVFLICHLKRKQENINNNNEDFLIDILIEIYFTYNLRSNKSLTSNRKQIIFCQQLLKIFMKNNEELTSTSIDAKTYVKKLNLNDSLKNIIKLNHPKVLNKSPSTNFESYKVKIKSSAFLGIDSLFIKRHISLHEIHNELKARNRVAITGIPGVGKKELVKAYVRKFKHNYSKIIWHDSEKHVLQESNDRKNCENLYIYDKRNELINDNSNCKVIIISEMVVAKTKNFKLDSFTEDESVILFRRNGKINNRLTPNIARGISKTVQHYPLALKEILKLPTADLIYMYEKNENFWKHAENAYNTVIAFAYPLFKNNIEFLYFNPYHIASRRKVKTLQKHSIISENEKCEKKLNEIVQTAMKLKFIDEERDNLEKCLIKCKKFTASTMYAEEHIAYIWQQACHYDDLILKYFDWNYNLYVQKTSTLHILSDFGMITEIQSILKRFDMESRKKLINAKNEKGCSSIHFAARTSTVLLNYFHVEGGDLLTTDNYGKTLLHYAVDGRMLHNVDFLLKKKLKLEAKDDKGYTVLQYAITKGNNKDIIEKLLDANSADSCILDNNKRNLLHIAAESGKIASITILTTRFDVSQLINKRDKYDFTPLHYAVKNCHINCVKYLINLNANVNVENENRLQVDYTKPGFHASRDEILMHKGLNFGRCTDKESNVIDKYINDDYSSINKLIIDARNNFNRLRHATI